MYILKDPKTNFELAEKVPEKKEGLSKKTIDIIRTTQRNNIELTAIADNKANVLLSLNAILIAALFPLILNNLEVIQEKQLVFPLIIFSITCLLTVFLAAKVLKPSNFKGKRENSAPGVNASPFFFGNFYKMESTEYYEYLEKGLSDPKHIKAHMAQDLYYVGKRLGYKMSWIRNAFNIFTTGVFLTILSIILTLVCA